MNKSVYRIFIFCFAIILLIVGTYVGLRLSDNIVGKNIKEEEIAKNNEEEIISVLKKEETTLDIEVIFEDYYNICKESIITKNTEFGTTIDKIKEKNINDYEVVEEGKNNIKFKKEIDSNCPNHFELKLENEFVVIYQIENIDKINMYKNTQIPKSSLREEIIQELENGIKLNSLEELNSIIEDIES